MYLTYRNSPDKREHQSRRQIARRDSAAVVYLPFADLRNRQEADVERIDSFAFYEVGKALQPLTAFSGDVPAEPAFWALFRAQSAINDLLAGKPIPIGFSHGKAEAFSAQLRTIMSEYFETQNQQGERVLKFPDEKTVPIPAWRWWRVTPALGEFETVFAEEMKETATYFVPRRGIYFTPALVDTADESFPRDLLGHIPQKTREDWKSAGRCLAFNLLSASGFHAARAVEGTMEAYYQLFSGRPGATLKNWNDYIEELRKIAAKNPKPAPETKTLAELDQMRTDYRNPIMHPRVVLSEPDARMLFANGESLIIAMAQEIARVKEQGGVQLALAGNSGDGATGEQQAGSGVATDAENTAKPAQAGRKVSKKAAS